MRRAAPRPRARRAALTPTCRPWGERGRGSWGRGAFVFLTHLSRQLVWRAGQSAVGRLLSALQPLPLGSPPPPPAIRALGLEEGALGVFKVTAFSPPRDPGLPDSSSFLPRNIILGCGPQGTLDFVLPGPPPNSWAHLRVGPVLTSDPSSSLL